MRYISLFSICAGMAILSGCTAARLKVTHLPQKPTPQTEELRGGIYALPRTVVTVKPTVQREAKTAGKHAKFADLFFPGRTLVLPPGSEPKVSFGLKTGTISTSGEPDPENVYAVELANGKALDQDVGFELTEQGSVSGTDVRVDNQMSDVILGAIGVATGIASRSLIGGGKGDECFKEPHLDGVLACLGLKENFDKLAADRQQELRDDWAKNANPLKAAWTDYDEEIRKRVDKIASIEKGTDVMNPSSFVEVVKAGLETAIQKFFTGSKESTTWEGQFEHRPPSHPIEKWDKPPTDAGKELFSLDESKGICDLADLRGATPPPANFIAGDCTGAKPVKLALALDAGDAQLAMIAHSYPEPKDPGLRYRIPARMKATVEWEPRPKPAAEARILVAQYGKVMALPASVDSKTVNYSLKFYESTGALKTFKLSAKPQLSKAAIDSIGGNVNTMLDAEKKRADAERASNDPLAKRERMRKILEEEQKILKLCAELGKDCTLP